MADEGEIVGAGPPPEAVALGVCTFAYEMMIAHESREMVQAAGTRALRALCRGRPAAQEEVTPRRGSGRVEDLFWE